MRTVKITIITVSILLALGLAAVFGLSYVADHCGWETGICR